MNSIKPEKYYQFMPFWATLSIFYAIFGFGYYFKTGELISAGFGFLGLVFHYVFLSRTAIELENEITDKRTKNGDSRSG